MQILIIMIWIRVDINYNNNIVQSKNNDNYNKRFITFKKTKGVKNTIQFITASISVNYSRKEEANMRAKLGV